MKKLVIGNWKMNPATVQDARSLALAMEHRMHQVHHQCEAVVCPPFVYLPPLSHYLNLVGLGAQNMSSADNGAFTGEISPKQLGQWGVSHVILGHSERRIYFNETNDDVSRKIAAALAHKIHPVVCLGGDKGIRKSETKRLVTRQFAALSKDLIGKDLAKIIFVYEPAWAISTMKNSKPATGEHASEMVAHIQAMLGKKLGKERAANMRILYGGTVNKANVHEFARYPIIDGALVGSASLDQDNFWAVIREFARESVHKEQP